MTLLTMGVASLPNGQPLFLLVALGVPTMSMMTEVVSQYDAAQLVFKDNNLQGDEAYQEKTMS
jgi:hypothetical protein